MNRFKSWLYVLALAGTAAAPAAHAQWAVVDVGAIAQLIQEVGTLDQALTTARNQLAQAQQEFQAITGSRGMQNLLSGTVRNYLPTNLTELAGALTLLNSSYATLSGSVQSTLQASAVLTPQQLAALSPQEQQQLQAVRNTAALLQGLAGTALANSSSRFTDLQQLISAIAAATDPKAIAELQARIGAEGAMLQNEQTKLQTLYQSMQAQQWSNAQQSREQVIAGHGQFATRFQPTP